MVWGRRGRTVLSGLLLGLCLCASGHASVVYRYHEVAEGEDVYKVASRYGVKPSSIIQANSAKIINMRGLQAGMVLVIPCEAGLKLPETKSAGSESSVPVPRNVLEADSSAQSQDGYRPVTGTPLRRRPPRPHVVSMGAGPSALVLPSQVNVATNSRGESQVIPAYRPSVNSAAQGAGGASQVLEWAFKFEGTPYVWGGCDPSGFDCSGYVQYVYNQVGVSLPRTADVQYNAGEQVGLGQEAPGDLVFFETYTAGPSHVGIFVGNDQFIHASSSSGVRVDNLSSHYYSEHYLGARRLL